MKISTKEVRNGQHTGKVVWVCHYLQPGLLKKPLRNVPPTEVQIVCNEQLPKNKTVYYSEVHFRQVKNGKVLSKVISPVDNTGHRMHCGNELHVFDSEAECIEQWNSEVKSVRRKVKEMERNW